MAWIGIITNNGNDLLTRWVEGKTLTVTRAAAGQGRVDPAAMLAQAALVNEKQAASIISNTPVDKGQRLKLQVTPQSEAGYSLNQFGVWARLEDEDEKMIALFQTDTDIGVEIPSKADMPDFVYTFYGLLAFSNQGTLHITVDPSTMITLDTMNAAIGAAVATREESIKNAEKKNDLADGDSVAIVDSADSSKTKRVLWSTIKSALSKIYVPLTRKINSKSLSSDVTLTGADIQVSRTDNTKIDAALSNKAPAGYGLGGNAIMTDSPDYNLDNISGSGWFVGAPKMDNFTFGSCLVENIQWSAGEGAQIAFLYPGTSSPAVYNTRIQRTKFNYAFGPWEWINPPMQLGIEYRTAERHNGQPVYAKAISFGKAPNASSKDISHGIENFGQLVSYTGMLDGANLIQNSMVDNIRINASAIRITTNTDASECYVYLTLYYTKTTD